MRHGTPNRRNRNRGHNGGGNNGGPRRGNGPTHNRNQIFDSNGPDVRIRGTAHQVCEKYLALAKDAASGGDVVLAESYMQHAEHYQRIINAWNEEFGSFQRQQNAGEAYVPKQDVDGNAHEDELALPASILGGDVKAAIEPSAEEENILEAV